MSYDTAAREVTHWIDELQAKLNNEETVQLEGIGQFKKDVEGNLRFHPDDDANFLLASYGLRTFQASPILRDKDDEQIVHAQPQKETTAQHTYPVTEESSFAKKNSDTSPLLNESQQSKPNKPTSQADKQVQRSNRRNYAMAATFLAIIALGQLIFLNITPNQFVIGYTSVFEYFNPVEDEDLIPEESPPRTPEIDKNPLQSQSNAFDLPETKMNESTSSAKDEVNPSSSSQSQKQDRNGYYVILGSFKQKENAEQLKRSIKDKPTSRIFRTDNGYHRVGYFLNGDKQTALAQFKRLQKTESKNIWLLHHQ